MPYTQVSPTPRSNKSPTWVYFDILESDEKFVVCKLCSGRFSRGGVGKNASTTPLLNHIKKMHSREYSLLNMKKPAKLGSITTGCGSPIINLAHNHVPDTHAVALARCRGILVTEPYPPGHIPVDETSQPDEPEIVMVNTDKSAENGYTMQNTHNNNRNILFSEPKAKAMENWAVRKTARGVRLIDGKGYTYTKDRSVGTKTYWRCDYKHYRCKSRASIEANTDVRHRPKVMFNLMTHGHPPQMKRKRAIIDPDLESAQNPLQTSQSVLKSRNVPSPSSSGPPDTSLGQDAEVCLRWNSYHTNMQTVFPFLMDNEKYVDVTLYADGKGIKCHKLILSSCSTYFEEILSNTNPNQHTVIVLRGFAYWQVKSLIAFMYKGEVNIDQTKLDDLLKAGSDLQIKGLAKEEKNPIETEDYEVPNEDMPEMEIKNEEPPVDDDDDDEDYFPNPEYKKKTVPKPKRKRKFSSPPDPSLLKQVKINLKGTKSRPNIKQPKYYSPDYPEYDPDRCVSPPKLGSDPVFHIDNIKLEPIDMDVEKSPDFLEMDSLMNDSQLTDNTGTESLPNTPKSRARIVKAKLSKIESKKGTESDNRNVNVEILNKIEVSKSSETITSDSAIPSTSKGITDPLTTTKRVIIEGGQHKKAIIVKCPKRNSDESFILSQLTDPSNKSDSDKPKPQIRVRNLATTETMLKKFATTQLTSILKKGEPINQPVICKKVGGLTRLLKAPAQTPPVTVEPDLVKYALAPPEEPEPKSDEEMGEIETLDEYMDSLPENADDEDYKMDLNLILPH